jgi:hypothetical protein
MSVTTQILQKNRLPTLQNNRVYEKKLKPVGNSEIG